MLRFFRQIRQRLLTDNKVSKYLLYAVGEILLVVIGILIALQIDNWNELRKETLKERALLRELQANLETNVENLESDIKIQITGASAIHFLLDHLDNKRAYIDTLDYLFQEADYVPEAVLSSSAFETLKSSGLGLVGNDSLRKGIIDLFEVKYPYLMQETRRLEDQLWTTTSVPLYQRYFRREATGRAHPTNYEALLNDDEFTNMLSFRVLMREASTYHKRKAMQETLEVLQMISDELN
ncbi:DUF6090 family protein [Robiginitalea sp. IMCC43444]|uniref:DUF6090 family protein n=1 Tax=Robiginitalea sp. IMCC43444 TaxID=3459121 RepID=UPI0040427BB8